MSKIIYFDNSATTKPCEKAVEAALRTMTEQYGNPSSGHKLGITAEDELTRARKAVSTLLGCEPKSFFFTSSGTAANNTAIFGTCERLRREGNTIVTTSVEHPSVALPIKKLETQGFTVIRVSPDKSGNINPRELADAITKDTVLVSIMAVNNETGAIFPVRSAREALKRVGAPGLLHTDCVQAFGKIKITPKSTGADIITVSAHKIHGIKGAGGIFISDKNKIKPFVLGGGQESGIFSGTEAMPAIAAFGAAAQEVNLEKDFAQVEKVREVIFDELSGCEKITFNSPSDALPYIINISLRGVRSEPALNALSAKGFAVSAGSACKKGQRSDALAAMGISPELIDSAIRISLSRYNTPEEAKALCSEILTVIEELTK